MTTTSPLTITLEEFLELPETKPASEFIEGRIHQKPMPQGKHSRLQYKLCDAVNQITEEKQVALAFPELRCTFGNRSIVPDVTVFAWERIPLDATGEISNSFNIHPDWTLEILSPDQAATRVISNILHCLDHGTQLGWFIDPGERAIIAFLPEQRPIELANDDRLPVPAFVDMNLTVAQIFDWLRTGK
jgi:Uma2 family endonuclease